MDIARLRSVLPKGGTLPDDVWRRRHRGILILLWLHLPALFIFALARGYTWEHGLTEAGFVGLPAMAAQLTIHRRRLSTICASVGLMTASAVLVHLSGGMIEAHFHFFVMVGVVVLYQDWLPFLVAIAFVVVHHGVVGVLSPHDVYNHQGAWDNPWMWAGIHGVSILAMSAAGIATWKLNERSQSQLANLAAIVESTDDAVYGWTVDGTINSWNSAAVELYGYTYDEIVGQHLSVLVPPELLAEAESRLDQIRRGERLAPFDSKRVRKDGTAVEASVTISAVRNANGDVIGGATIARDITGRRRAEEALRTSEERTRGIIDTARDAFVGMDDDGLITDWNHSAEVAFGWSREEVIGRPLAETIIPPQYRAAHHAGLRHYLATGEGPVLDRRVEMTGLHRDGHEFPIEMAVWRVGTGAGAHFSAFIQDITERKRDERELQETLSLLAATLESTADGILVVDPNGAISSFNGKFAQMWRLPAEVLESRDDNAALPFVLDQLVDPDDFMARVHELYVQPEAESHDTLYFKDGRVFERSSKPQRVAGAVVGRVWSFHDVTDPRRLEAELAEARDKALESSRLKSEFLATMSHEIRTPMNGIIGLTGLLLDTGLTEIQRQYGDGVRASAEALLGIINDILDFSKIEAGKLELEMVDFSLAQALDDVAALVAEPARAKGLELIAQCDADVPEMLRGDVGRLRQILLNLVSNAVKFTPAGQVVLRAGLGAATGPHRLMVHLEVADTGIGIDAATAGRLFEPFLQADASTTRQYGGTGLGLAICRRLAEAMGGTIGVDSNLGEGSTFWFDLPFLPAAHAGDVGVRSVATTAAEMPPFPTQPVGSRGRLLVVEDNAINQAVAKGLAAKVGYDCDLAANGIEALDALERRPYDAVLMDCQMPEMDGFEATAEIRRREMGENPIPIIAMTASALAEDRDRCLAAGMDDYLAKPVKGRDLDLVLRRWLPNDGRRRRRPVMAHNGAPSDDRVDEDQLAELFGLLPAGPATELPAILELFLNETASRLEVLKVALATHDLSEAARVAHSLSGSAGSFGARRLSALGKEVEAACGQADAETASALVPTLRSEFEAFRMILLARVSRGAVAS